jgi:CheY-like chemotaxis protein
MTKTILIAEDDERLRHSLASILEEVGYSVVEASNDKEVVQDLKTSADFCLLLTDIVMPEMEGLELIRHLRRLPSETTDRCHVRDLRRTVS